MTTVPTVGVNLLWLVPGVVGGSEEYTLRLLRALGPEPDGFRLRLYAQAGLVAAHPDLAGRFETLVAPSTPGGKGGRIALEHGWLPVASRADAVVHHAGGVVPLVRSQVPLVTIHDLQPLEHPENFAGPRRRWLAAMLPRSARAARLVLCPSEFTAGRVERLLGVSPARIRVVPHGLDAPSDPGADLGAGPASGVSPGLDAGGASPGPAERFGRYLLLPGIAYRHKRHRDLVAALDRLRDRHPRLSVVLTGRPGPESTRLDRLIAGLGLDGRVHRLGRVPEDELARLYRSAEAVVFPSAYEGFGNPVLEAMAAGTPVVCSDGGALPEVAGDAAMIVPVGDVNALVAAVDRLLTEPERRVELVRLGRRRAASHGASRAADALAGCYRQALHRAGRP